MFGNHFYHSILRKSVAVFGTLFNDMKILRRGSSNQVESMVKVPIAYGPKQKFLARIDQQRDFDDSKTAIKLPRMSFEMIGLSFDPAAKQSAFNKINVNDDTGNTQALIRSGSPYIVDMQLNIMVKNQDDGLQIVEQILPAFQPTYNVSVKFLDGLDQSYDVPITLNSITFVDDYEGDYQSRRVIIYTLDFSMKVRFFPGTETKSVIRQVFSNFINQDDRTVIESVQTQPNPVDARKNENWKPDTAILFVTFDLQLQLTFNGNVLYQANEIVIGSTTGYTAVVDTVTYDVNTNETTITVRDPDGYFLVGETVGGVTSAQGDTLVKYEIIS